MRIYSFSDVDNTSVDRASIGDLVLNNGQLGLVDMVNNQMAVVPLLPTYTNGMMEIRDQVTNNVIMSFSLDEVVFPGRVKSLAGDPINGSELVTKDYVDMSIAAAIAALGV